MSRKKYQRYSREFKLEAIRLAEASDNTVTQVARELGWGRKGDVMNLPHFNGYF